MSEDIDIMMVKLKADFSELSKALAKAETVTKTRGMKIKGALKSIGKASVKTGGIIGGLTTKFAGLGASIAGASLKFTAMTGAVGIATASFVALDKTMKAFTEVGGMSLLTKRLGISVESFSKMSIAAGKFGIETEELGDTMKDLSERVADAAANGGSYEEALNRIGLTGKELLGLKMDEQFERVTKGLAGLETQGDKAFVAMELMADAGFKVVNMADAGEEAIAKMKKEAEEMGLVTTSFDAAAIELANEAMKDMQRILERVGEEIAVEISPYITFLSKQVIAFRKNTGPLYEVWEDIKISIDGLKPLFKLLVKIGDAAFKTFKAGAMGLGLVMENAAVIAEMAWLTWQQSTLKALKSVKEQFFMFAKQAASMISKLPIKEAKQFGMMMEIVGNMSMEQTQKSLDGINEKIVSLSQNSKNTMTEIDEAAKATEEAMATIMNIFASEDENGEVKKGPIARLVDDFKEYFPVYKGQVKAKAEQDEEKRNEEINQEAIKNKAIESIADKHFKEQAKKTKAAADMNKSLWESGLKGRVEVTRNLLGQMSVLMETNSRKQFEIGKAASIAAAVIDTYKAATGAYSALAGIPIVGPALGAAAAGAAIAAGVANVQKIKSQSFGGGGGGGGAPSTASASAGGAGAASPAAAATGGGQSESQEPAAQSKAATDFNVTLQGESFGAEQVRGLLTAINDQLDDNATINTVVQ